MSEKPQKVASKISDDELALRMRELARGLNEYAQEAARREIDVEYNISRANTYGAGEHPFTRIMLRREL